MVGLGYRAIFVRFSGFFAFFIAVGYWFEDSGAALVEYVPHIFLFGNEDRVWSAKSSWHFSRPATWRPKLKFGSKLPEFRFW